MPWHLGGEPRLYASEIEEFIKYDQKKLKEEKKSAQQSRRPGRTPRARRGR
jgi:hypothetical protein